jgi:putative membrane protein
MTTYEREPGLANESTAEPGGDPRVYFAAERTLLAWLRTGIAIMAFGFVVARFGLFLRLLDPQAGAQVGHGISSYLGAALVGLGVLATAAGAVQYRRFYRTLPASDRPKASSPGFSLGLSWALVLIGLALGMVLLV